MMRSNYKRKPIKKWLMSRGYSRNAAEQVSRLIKREALNYHRALCSPANRGV